MDDRAAGGRRARPLGQPVDDPEAVEQRAGHEVAGPRRRQRRRRASGSTSPDRRRRRHRPRRRPSPRRSRTGSRSCPAPYRRPDTTARHDGHDSTRGAAQRRPPSIRRCGPTTRRSADGRRARSARRRPDRHRPPLRRAGRRHADLVPRRRLDHVRLRAHGRAGGARPRATGGTPCRWPSPLLLYVSVLIHELSHTVVALQAGPAGPADQPAPAGRRLRDRGAGQDARPGGRHRRRRPAGLAVVLRRGGVRRRRRCSSRTRSAGCSPGADGRATSSSACSTCCPGCRSTAAACSPPAVWRLTGRRHTGTVVAAWLGAASRSSCSCCPFVARGLASARELDLIDVVWGALLGSFIWVGATQALQARRLQQRLPGAVRPRADPAGDPGRRRRCRWPRRCAGAPRPGARHLVVVSLRRRPGRRWSSRRPSGRRPSSGGPGCRSATCPAGSSPATGHGRPGRRGAGRGADAAARPASTSWSKPNGDVYGVLATADVERALVGPAARPDGPSFRPCPTPRISRSSTREPPCPAWRVAHRRRAPPRPVRGGRPGAADRPQGPDAHDHPGRRARSSTPTRARCAHDDADRAPGGHGRSRRPAASTYLALRPLLADYVLSMPRGAAVVYPRTPARSCTWPTSSPAPGSSRPASGRARSPCRCCAPSATTVCVSSYERRAGLRRHRPRQRRDVLRRPAPGLAAHGRRPGRRRWTRPTWTGSCSTCSRRGTASTRSPAPWCPAGC